MRASKASRCWIQAAPVRGAKLHGAHPPARARKGGNRGMRQARVYCS
jgi:hypothetical protein